MRLAPVTDGRSHDALIDVTPNQHHPRPESHTIDSAGVVSLPPGTTYDLDITLSHSDFQFARVMLMGARTMFGTSGNFRECAEIHVTRDSGEAFGHTVRDAALSFKCYAVTLAKQTGATYLTHAIFDSDTVIGNQYICLQDAWITGSTLRLRFKNLHGGSVWLWVKGQAIVW